jgi:hypothetical protein
MTAFTFTIRMTVDVDIPADQLDAVMDRLVDEAENLIARHVGGDAVHVDETAVAAKHGNAGPHHVRPSVPPGDWQGGSGPGFPTPRPEE